MSLPATTRLLALLGLFTACTPDLGDRCARDLDCPMGERCAAGRCFVPAARDAWIDEAPAADAGAVVVDGAGPGLDGAAVPDGAPVPPDALVGASDAALVSPDRGGVSADAAAISLDAASVIADAAEEPSDVASSAPDAVEIRSDARVGVSDAAMARFDVAAWPPDAAIWPPDAAAWPPDVAPVSPDAEPAPPDAALFPPDAAESPPDAEPPPDAAPPPPDAAPPDLGCVPGQPVGLCTLCSSAGEPVPALDDPSCPAPLCSALDAYDRLEDNSGATCRMRLHGLVAPLCAGPGLCRGEAACGVTAVAELLHLPAEPCRVLTGCEGDDPPSIEARPEGTPCNRVGTCRSDGTCSADPRCARFVGGTFCGQDLAGDQPSCDVYMPVDLVRRTCDAFCRAHDSVCLGGYNDLLDTCTRADAAEIACDALVQDNVCRCAM